MAPRTTGNPKGADQTADPEGVTAQAAPVQGSDVAGTPPLDRPATNRGDAGAEPAGAPAAAEAEDEDSGYVELELANHLTIDERTRRLPGVTLGRTYPPKTKVAVPYNDVMAFINSGYVRGVETRDGAAIKAAHQTRVSKSKVDSYPLLPQD